MARKHFNSEGGFQRRRKDESRRKRDDRRARRRVGAVGLLLCVIAAVIVAVLSSNPHGSPSQRQSGALRTHGSKGAGGGAGNVARDGRNSAVPADHLPAPSRDVSAPILMYHVVNPPIEGAPYPGLYVPKAEFAEQMHALAKAGFHGVTLQQLWQHWRTGAPLPGGKPVVISFDNGYQSQYTNALPILRRYGWKAIENIQLSGLPPSQGGLSQAQVKGLVQAGWELDTQGYSHAELTALTPSQLHFQVAVARHTLQRRYDVPVRWFCYPSGHYDAAVLEAVKAAGFSGATTVIPGWASPESDPYRLPRIRVLGGTTGSELISLIEGSKSDASPPATYE